MSFNLANIETTKGVTKSPLVVLSGTAGVGKSTLCAGINDRVFLRIEDGLVIPDVPTFPLVETFDQVLEAIDTLQKEEHDFGCLVIDSIDVMEPLIWEKVCEEEHADSIEKVGGGYGKGYIAAAEHWRKLCLKLAKLRDTKGITIVLISHVQIKKFEAPGEPGVDRYEIKLHKAASAIVQQWADMGLFAQFKFSLIKEDAGWGKTRTRGTGRAERVINTVEAAGWVAKNRYGLPEEIPFKKEGTWDEIEKLMVGAPDEGLSISVAGESGRQLKQ